MTTPHLTISETTPDFEKELGRVRHKRKKAEIALRAGIFFIKKYSEGLDYSDLSRSANYFKQAESNSAFATPNRINIISRVYLSRIDTIESRHEFAFDSLQNIEPEVNSINDSEARAVWCHSIALLYYYLGDYAKAHKYTHEALDIYTGLGFHHETMLCLYNIGIYSYEIGNYHDAFISVSRALELGLEYGSPFLEYYYVFIGKVCLYNGNNHADSISYIEKGIEIFRQKADSVGLVFSYSTIANFYLSKEEINNAIHWFDECLRLNYESAKSNVFFLLHYGDALLQQQKYAHSLEIFEQTLAISRIRNDAAYIVKIQRRIATILVNLSQYEQAQELLKDCLEYYSPPYEDAFELSKIYEHLSKVSEQVGNIESALQYYKLYHQWETKHHEQKQRFDMENAKHRVDIEIATREREELKYKASALERDLDTKRGELTSLALALSQKNQIIDKLENQLKEFADTHITERDSGHYYSSLLKEIESLRSSGEVQWSHLQQQFESMDNSFSTRLLERYSNLSQLEIKVCLLIRLNLSSKDIAHVLWISHRTVETHRYQIRKKMHLSKTDNLFFALANI
jgi:tetratricopeptide (TPR) repeat protein/DNA-binding CsgD family transcriptional regulator